MSLRNLPEAKITKPKNYHWDCPSDILAKWSALEPMAADEGNATISIFDEIGLDSWTGRGFTAKRMEGALRAIGKNDVTVLMNTPGGDVFEAIAIYNLLREHPARVDIKVMGIAASGGSIIAMAGDDIAVGLGGFIMVHNAWGGVIGNRHDMREAADVFEGFDSALIDIYQARTGQDRAAIIKLMDKESYMSASQAVESGFADRVDDGLKAPENDAQNHSNSDIQAKRQMDAILAKSGVSRVERRRLFKEIANGTHDAAETVTQDANLDIAALNRLKDTIGGLV